MERPMKQSKLPETDSIQKLAEFWDSHDLTDYEDELEEVGEPVFVRGAAIKVPLESREVEAVEQMAQAKGISREELIRVWVQQKLTRRNKSRPTAIWPQKSIGAPSNSEDS
jgi:predicted DNA binding CopG/RHH family protein